jgi:hypothetical protein
MGGPVERCKNEIISENKQLAALKWQTEQRLLWLAHSIKK